MTVSWVARCCGQGESGLRGGGHGPWCIDFGQRGRGEPVVGRSFCGAKVWEADDQREVVDGTLWLGEEGRRLLRKWCARGVLLSGPSLNARPI